MVRILSRVALSTALLALLVVPAAAQDVSGDWEFSFQGPQGPATIPVTFTQEGAEVTGSAMMQGNEVVVSDGMLEGDKLTFAFHLEFDGQTFSLTFSATVDGDTMEGMLAIADGTSVPFTATKKEGS